MSVFSTAMGTAFSSDLPYLTELVKQKQRPANDDPYSFEAQYSELAVGNNPG
jgi:hypothetical protein